MLMHVHISPLEFELAQRLATASLALYRRHLSQNIVCLPGLGVGFRGWSSIVRVGVGGGGGRLK